MSFFGRRPSDPPAPNPAAAAADVKNDDLPLPDDIRLGENVLRFNHGTWTLMTEASADHKRQIDDLQKRVDALLAERNNSQQQLSQLSHIAAQSQAQASQAAAADQKYSADANRRVQELERENQLLKWKNQVLLAMVAVRELDNDQFGAQIEQAVAH